MLPLMVEGKIGLITGAGQGIGRAIAVEMARQGAAAIAVVDRSAETAAQTAGLAREAGADAEAIVCDLRDRDQIEAMVDGTVARFGGLDVLVNNAGIIETSLTDQCAVDTLPEEVWDAVYEVNLRAVWLATKFAAPHLRRSTRGPNIVNAASVSGLTAFPLGPIYCTSKAGVVQLTKVTAVDLAPAVRCNSIVWAPPKRSRSSRASWPPTTRPSSPAGSIPSTEALSRGSAPADWARSPPRPLSAGRGAGVGLPRRRR